VTGPLGGSLKSGRHLTFIPKIAEAQYLARYFKPSAMIDLSDGLLSDVSHFLKKGQSFVLVDELIPRHKGVNLKQACCDGEDFELLFALPPQKAKKLIKKKHKDFKFYPVGYICRETGKKINIETGFHHF
jgi:thiamine-monophosphate kinase